MTTQQIVSRFDELAQQNRFDLILTELFSENAVSIEPESSPFPSVKGLKKILEKGNQFHAMVEEMHGGWCTKPLLAGDYFTCTMGMDVTLKGMGRQNFIEVAVYKVKDGKIISEQFFF